MQRPAGDAGKRQPGQQGRHTAFGINRAKPLFDHLCEVDPTPANNAMNFRVGTCLDDITKLHQLRVG